jgi:predicted RNA binding protein YcfA (HicA-like mRNA interferase family)
MTKLPVLSGRQCIRALQKMGFVQRRQSGSHIIMQRQDPFTLVSVPNHRTLKPGILRKIIKDVGLSVSEFAEFLD